jgi:hypothetical protein
MCPIIAAVLARAPAETLDDNALIVLIGAGVAAGAAVLAAVPGVVARRRLHRQREGLTALAVVWALATAAAVVWAVNRDWAASVDRQRQIESGDVDPRDPVPDPPSWWPVWAGLGVGYLGLVAWALGGGATPPLPADAPPR